MWYKGHPRSITLNIKYLEIRRRRREQRGEFDKMEYSSASPSKPCYNFLHEALRGVLYYLGFETKTQQAADGHQLPADNTDEEDQHDGDVHKVSKSTPNSLTGSI